MPNYESYQVIKEITLDLVAPGLAPVVNVRNTTRKAGS